MQISIYDYTDYKKYVAALLSNDGSQKRSRSQLARTLKVRPSFISQVLNGAVHLSCEHGVLINEYVEHDEGESEYFLLLIHLGRAGSRGLREVYLKQIDKIRRYREEIRERIQVKREISGENQMIYYSSWHYAAAHVLISTPGFQTLDELSKRIVISTARTKEILEFLETTGLIRLEAGYYKVGEKRIHLGHNSSLISKHHTNWRIRAIESLDGAEKNDLHFSTVFAVSKTDMKRIRELCLKLIEETENVIRPSPEEAVGCMTMDLFKI